MSRQPDTADRVAFNPSAPQAERSEALAELQKSHAPTSLRDMLLPAAEMREVVEYISDQWQDAQMAKAMNSNIIPFPSKFAREKRRGMQSVYLDNLQITAMGDYWEKPTTFGFDAMRQMVAQTPVLNAVILTRVRQVQRFCRVNESGYGPGFTIAHIDKGHELTEEEQTSVRLLGRFMMNCGWESNPRARRRQRRDSFGQFVAKLVRDSLTLDSAPIETELARDKAFGIDGLYAVDGATIRLCTEDGYKGDDEIFALQVVQGRISSAYTYDDLIYEARNPQSDVLTAGYGFAETEMMIRVVTGFLNAMSLNIKGFDSNAIPKGVLHLTGNYDDRDIAAFKRYWNSMVRGVQNAWALPVMVSKDQESKASFEKFGIEFNEMYFSKWMTFLTSIICAIYGMSPAEINFDSFTAGNTSALSGSDTDEKIAASKDSGLWPLLSYFEGLFSDYIVADFSDKYVFRWTGIDEDDADKREERARLVMTVNEMRAQERLPPLDGEFGDAPLNPSLTGIWMQLKQAEQPQDFGRPPGGGQEGQGGDDQDGDDDQAGQDQSEQDAQEGPQAAQEGAQGALRGAGGARPPPPGGGDRGGGQQFAKANPNHDAKGRFARGRTTITSSSLPGGGGDGSKSVVRSLWRQLRDKVIAQLRDVYKEPATVPSADGDMIIVSYGGLRHALNNGVPSPEESTLALHIKEAIGSAKAKGEPIPDKGNRKDPHSVTYYHTEVMFDGVLNDVDIVVRNHSDGRRYYDHAVIQKESPAGLSESAAGGIPSVEPAPPFTGLQLSIKEIMGDCNEAPITKAIGLPPVLRIELPEVE